MYWFYKITKMDFRKGSKKRRKDFWLIYSRYTNFFGHRKYEGTGSGKISDL